MPSWAALCDQPLAILHKHFTITFEAGDIGRLKACILALVGPEKLGGPVVSDRRCNVSELRHTTKKSNIVIHGPNYPRFGPRKNGSSG